MIKENLYFQICQLPVSDCAVKKSLPNNLLCYLNPLQFCVYCIPSLTRLRNVLVFRLSLTSVSQPVRLQIILCNLCVCIWSDSSESAADALSEPACLSTVISYIDSLTLSLSQQACVSVFNICRFACVRSEPALSFVCVCVFAVARSEPAFVVYTCLLTLFLSQHLLSTRRRYFAFAPKVTLTAVNLGSLLQTILFIVFSQTFVL